MKKLTVPDNIQAQPLDNSVNLSWNAVDGAYGYIVRFFMADSPERCVKKRYAKGTEKLFMGFLNGREYLACVSSYRFEKGVELESACSEKIPFVPVSETLKAQNVICLHTGERGQIYWERLNKMPMAHFKSDNEQVVKVGKGGMLLAVAEGAANVTVTAEGQKFTTKIYVDRAVKSADTRAVLMFTGSLMCTALQQQTAAERCFDFSGCFDGVRDILTSSDMAVGVLETVCCDEKPYEYEQQRLDSGAPNCNTPSAFLTAVAGAGYDVLVTANNHNRDCGYDGLLQTTEHIKHNGMENLGTLGDNLVIRNVRGIKTAVIAFTMASNNQDNDVRFEDRTLWGCYSREYFTSLVDTAKKNGAEYIIAYQHWGSMNSRIVTEKQLEEAQFMADNGADVIIGTHPHILQEIRYLISADGRVVPCAFSLGNLLSSESEFAENRDSAILRTELVRTDKGISSTVSVIPCHGFDTLDGVTIRPVHPSYSERSLLSAKRIQNHIGKAVRPYGAKPKAVLSGSVILERIFNSGSPFTADKAPLLLSQLSACTGEGMPCDDSGAVKLDAEKSFASYIKTCGADFIAVDFYSAAAISCLKMDKQLYTCSKKFLDSKFYKKHKDEMKRVKPPFSEKLWKPCIRRYAKAVQEAFPSERIILFRQSFSDKSVAGTLRYTENHESLNKRIAEMEEYFISLVNPCVVDLSKYYFSCGSSPSDIEREYFVDAAAAVQKILTEGRRYIDRPAPDLWYDRVLRYYEGMTSRSLQRWLLNMRSAADMLIAYTNENFAARHRNRLMRLKRMGSSVLSEVRSFYADDCGADEIVKAAELINAVLMGDLAQPYDFYADAFRENYNILKIMAKLLSAELQAPITSESAELAFLLRGHPQRMRKYLERLKEITVDVWGSALSKGVLDRCKNARIGRYIFGQCPLLANEPLVPVAIPQDDTMFSGNNWRRRMTEEAFSRMGMFSLTQTGSKWLVMDFYDAVNRMAEYGGGLFVLDEFLENTDFYKNISADCTPCYLFEKRSMEQCRNALRRFTEDLTYRYGRNIILIKTDLKSSFITLSDRLQPIEEDKYLELKRKFVAVCEKYFEEYTGCCVLDIAKYYHASDRHPDGRGDVNYEEAFYRRAAEYVSYVVNGGTTRLFNRADDNYIRMRELRLTRSV